MNDINSIVEKEFSHRSWRVSVGVRRIVNALKQSHSFLTVQEIAACIPDDEQINTSTIYRILQRLVHIGVVHQWHDRWKMHETYDPNGLAQRHFIVCDRCKKAESIPLDYKRDLAKHLSQEKKFTLRKADVTFLGLCHECTNHR